MFHDLLFSNLKFFKNKIKIKFFSIYQFGFRKGFRIQHFIVDMLEKWRICIGKDKSFGAFITDVSKTLKCLSHNLLIAETDMHGF